MATRIGSDEALKGDTFGGIVVAAVRADDEVRKQLEEMGVKDSKKLTDQKIRVLAERIRGIAPVFFVSMLPLQFNQEVAKYSLTGVMNKLHEKVTSRLRKEEEEVIVDQFPGCDVHKATIVQKAEDLYIEVAAASIIARAEGLLQIKELSIMVGFQLPLGSTHVLESLIKIRDGKKDFNALAKTSFRNVKEIMHTQQQEPI